MGRTRYKIDLDRTYVWSLGSIRDRTVNPRSGSPQPRRSWADPSRGQGERPARPWSLRRARLLRTAPSGAKTLFLDGHEVSAAANGTNVRATRTYSFAGQLIATRTVDGVDYLLADQQGSIEISIPSGASSPDAARTYMPYGEARSGNGDDIDTDRGWLGQIEDDSTDLSFLNARYYDSNMSRFISADPLYDQARPQTVNPYGYGLGNPTTNTDASGLSPSGAKKLGRSLLRGAGKFAGSRQKLRYKKARVQIKLAESHKRAYKAQRVAIQKSRMIALQQLGRTALIRVSKHHATLRKMHAACPTAQCAGLYKALNSVGPNTLRAIAAGIRAREQLGKSLNSMAGFYSISGDSGDGGGSWGDSGGDCDLAGGWGGAMACVADAAKWYFEHTERTAGSCVIMCLGAGQQGATLFGTAGMGCCFSEVSAGMARKEYEDRQCSSYTLTAPIAGILGAYVSVGKKEDGSIDWGDFAGGPSLGAGGGVAQERSYDVNGDSCNRG